MKKIVFVTALVAALPAYSSEVVSAKVYDRYAVVSAKVPYNTTECSTVDVPVYAESSTPGNAAEGALVGMIIGGILGKGITGNDDAAAAGAVMGGLIGADKGAKPKTSQRIIGYTTEQRCQEVTRTRTEDQRVYTHSFIEFELDGKIYSVTFQR